MSQEDQMEEFVYVADIKCSQNEVVRFVNENELTTQEAFEQEACIHAGSKLCSECDWRVE